MPRDTLNPSTVPNTAIRLDRIEFNLAQLLSHQVDVISKMELMRCSLADKLLLDARAAERVIVQTEKVQDHDDRIAKLEEAVTSMVWPVRIGIAIGSALGLSVIGLIWALITGSLQLVTP